MTGMIDKGIFISWSNYLRDAIKNLKEERYDFDLIAEMNIITLAHERVMAYDFYVKHDMPAFEWKLSGTINKDKNLINNIPRNWRHPNITNFDCYRNNIIRKRLCFFIILKLKMLVKYLLKHVLIVHIDICIHINLFVWYIM